MIKILPIAIGFSQDKIEGPQLFNQQAFNDKILAGASFEWIERSERFGKPDINESMPVAAGFIELSIYEVLWTNDVTWAPRN